MRRRKADHMPSRTPDVNARYSRESYRPPCPHYPGCFGCPLINLPYPQQLTKKRQRLLDAFSGYTSLARVAVPDVVPSPRRLGYRARVKLVVRRTKGEVATGLYVPESHNVVDISSCPVHPRPVNQVLHYLKKKLQDLDISPYDERNDAGQLRYLDFRYSFARRELNVTLVTRNREFPQGLELARALMRRFSFVTGVVQNINPHKGNVIWGEQYRSLGGRDTIVEKIGGLQLAFPTGVFSQANPSTAQKLYETVVQFARLSGKETVLDLYCGVGPISLSLAAQAHLVRGVDDSSLSVATAKQNARRNGISNCRFVVGDVAEQLDNGKRELAQIDCVIVNPPRKGIQPLAMEALLALRCRKVIYVSCNPVSLARDLDKLSGAAYGVRRLQPFDMFPQTEEVESVALLELSGEKL